MSGEEFFCCLNLATSTEEVELFFPPEITLHKTFPVYCHIFGDLRQKTNTDKPHYKKTCKKQKLKVY
jgi:hypothetical protein